MATNCARLHRFVGSATDCVDDPDISTAKVLSLNNRCLELAMVGFTEDTALIIDACAYVIELYRELTEENGAPTPGTQNQAVNFILADPLLSRHVKAWGESRRVDEATAAPPQRLPFDETYRRVRDFLVSSMDVPVFERKDRD